MSRRQRLVLPEVPLHIIQRGNNRLPCFFADTDYLVYLDLLKSAAQLGGCRIHAYVLMTNHVHLLVSPICDASPGIMMKALGERYVQYVNRRYDRIGTLWQGRYRSCLVQDERYLFVCQRYIELNPVRAQMVKHPGDYRWSSYRRNANGEPDSLVAPHSLYEGLGAEQSERELRYRALFEEDTPSGLTAQIRRATNGNTVFGSETFIERVAVAIGKDVMHRRSGRRHE
ncbi:transposase [Massilia sp. CCM 9210]|uniref:transposase n=1 Tax=Massilia scottii TaxID=3057166 RepID=UPI0027969F08|nr:transposase [Massilia sp. CCM 9210]MDQ1812717.1 transposase [Massilia sp. CCM 9210]